MSPPRFSGVELTSEFFNADTNHRSKYRSLIHVLIARSFGESFNGKFKGQRRKKRPEESLLFGITARAVSQIID